MPLKDPENDRLERATNKWRRLAKDCINSPRSRFESRPKKAISNIVVEILFRKTARTTAFVESEKSQKREVSGWKMSFLRVHNAMKYYLQCHLFQLHFMARRKVSRIMEGITVRDMGEEKLVFSRERDGVHGSREKGETTIPHLISFMFECYLASLRDFSPPFAVCKVFPSFASYCWSRFFGLGGGGSEEATFMLSSLFSII